MQPILQTSVICLIFFFTYGTDCYELNRINFAKSDSVIKLAISQNKRIAS